MQDYKVTIIDFDDSFSHNICSQLFSMGIDSELKNFRNFNSSSSQVSKQVFILGPGPGHPRDYPDVVKSIYGKNGIYIMGVCLGHQMILHFLGFKLLKKISPTHGQSKIITLPGWSEFETSKLKNRSMYVQEYNSLFVSNEIIPSKIDIDLYSDKDEVIMARNKFFISYQFHPESVGTSMPNVFFKNIADMVL